MNITAGKRKKTPWCSTEYRNDYVKDLVKGWNNQFTTLSAIPETQPQAAYSAFSSGFKSQLNYFLRTTLNVRHLLLPLERPTRNKFIPAVTGDHISNDKVRVPVSLPTRYGGVLAIPIFHKATEITFINSSKIT